MGTDLDPLVARLRDDFVKADERLAENRHDPRALDALLRDYRLLANMAITEAERLQGTIYQYYSQKNTK
jgi:hypothetical protein